MKHCEKTTAINKSADCVHRKESSNKNKVNKEIVFKYKHSSFNNRILSHFGRKKTRIYEPSNAVFIFRTWRNTDEIAHVLYAKQLLLNKFLLVRHTVTSAEHPNAEQSNFSRISLRD